VPILGITANPDGPWTAQQIRDPLTDLDDRAAGFRFRSVTGPSSSPRHLTRSWPMPDIGALNIPSRSPRANAYAERFVLTARTEVTDRMLVFGARHLRTVPAEYEAHCNGRRPYRGRQLRPPWPGHPAADLPIRLRPVLGGLISEYERPHRRPGQDQRPSSGTPQDDLDSGGRQDRSACYCTDELLAWLARQVIGAYRIDQDRRVNDDHA
jgi:hypothetical protein